MILKKNSIFAQSLPLVLSVGPWLKKVFLPSSITKIDDEFFSQAYPKIIVPKGMMVYFKKIVPERFKDKAEEQE